MFLLHHDDYQFDERGELEQTLCGVAHDFPACHHYLDELLEGTVLSLDLQCVQLLTEGLSAFSCEDSEYVLDTLLPGLQEAAMESFTHSWRVWEAHGYTAIHGRC
eukprot:gnl/Spiro4/26325_TR13140_c0_g1_i1.p1 gnl/Spiro4/26325_TR13140_c0_g1~~gnl/Spiro4/26325_TR13140_c0_g1_i1.p1  ORF type:complete len:105 (+),score=9.99 gnl/Spiro4/26325_TR13140_c0_g1_i1:263-577(+)